MQSLKKASFNWALRKTSASLTRICVRNVTDIGSTSHTPVSIFTFEYLLTKTAEGHIDTNEILTFAPSIITTWVKETTLRCHKIATLDVWVPFCVKELHAQETILQPFQVPHSPAGELEVRKNLAKDFKGATRVALMRASKWAPHDMSQLTH